MKDYPQSKERIVTAICEELKHKHGANVWEYGGTTWATVGWSGPYMSDESSGEIDIDAGALADAVVAALGLTENTDDDLGLA